MKKPVVAIVAAAIVTTASVSGYLCFS